MRSMVKADLGVEHATRILRDELSKIGGVICIYLFGSLARGNSTNLSDIDLAVLLKLGREEDMPKVMDILARVLGDRADISDLRSLPLSIKFRAVRDGVLLYASDDMARARFEARVIDEYLDMEPHREEYLEGWFEDAASGGS